jgi:hypothetical protein
MSLIVQSCVRYMSEPLFKPVCQGVYVQVLSWGMYVGSLYIYTQTHEHMCVCVYIIYVFNCIWRTSTYIPCVTQGLPTAFFLCWVPLLPGERGLAYCHLSEACS